jgi:transposase
MRQSRMRREPVMERSITWVGLDAHKKSISVAMLLPGRQVAEQWSIEHDEASIRRLVRKLEKEAGGSEIRCCYEAGPCGYALQRTLERTGKLVCEVVAPSLIPVKPGERIKTDSRDARKLAEMLRAGLLTQVHPPTEEEEALRDLCRCRADARADLQRARHRLGKMLLRRGIVYRETSRPWTNKHMEWLKTLRFENTIDKTVFDDYLLAIAHVHERLRGLDAKLDEAAQHPRYREHVAWLRCFRGIDTTTALSVLAELHGVERFQHPRQLAAYLGLVPSEHSSGNSVRRGGITKAGNSHVRRLLIEACWHYRHRAGVGPKLRRRREGQPAHIIAIADRAQQRLCRRYQGLLARGKTPNKVVVATARELVGFLWAALQPQ